VQKSVTIEKIIFYGVEAPDGLTGADMLLDEAL
jgi:hypothetical protein